jgi:hypothetical protein
MHSNICPETVTLQNHMTRLLRAQTPLEIQTRRAHFGAQAEIRTVTTLRSKRAEILASISLYEKRLAQARADPAHVTACIAIFEASGDGEELSSYVDTHRMFAQGEIIVTLRRGPRLRGRPYRSDRPPIPWKQIAEPRLREVGDAREDVGEPGLDFFIAAPFNADPELWEEYIEDTRFRGAYLRIAETWEPRHADLVRERLIVNAADK